MANVIPPRLHKVDAPSLLVTGMLFYSTAVLSQTDTV